MFALPPRHRAGRQPGFMAARAARKPRWEPRLQRQTPDTPDGRLVNVVDERRGGPKSLPDATPQSHRTPPSHRRRPGRKRPSSLLSRRRPSTTLLSYPSAGERCHRYLNKLPLLSESISERDKTHPGHTPGTLAHSIQTDASSGPHNPGTGCLGQPNREPALPRCCIV